MKYFLKKTGTLIITLLLISFLSFLAFQVIPGNAAVSQLGTQATPDKIQALEAEYGLDQPVLVRYGSWLGHFITGDMGESYNYSLPVSKIIADKLPVTLTMTLLAFLMMLLVSVPLGLLCAKYQGRAIDRVISILNQVVMSVPGFFIGILFTYLFGLILRWFTPGAYVSLGENLGGFLAYLILPSLAVALPKCAMGVKLLRGSIIEETHKDYVRTAYSRGNSTGRVLLHHVLKNSLLPVMTFWALAIADIVASSFIVEQVFTIPGLGNMLIQSISNRDYPVVQGIIVLIAGIVVGVNFLVDILYGKIDPRIQLKKL